MKKGKTYSRRKVANNFTSSQRKRKVLRVKRSNNSTSMNVSGIVMIYNQEMEDIERFASFVKVKADISK